MIILRFNNLLDFLKDAYGLEISQKKFGEIAGISPDRLSRIKKSGLRNVTTQFLNQILEGCWKLIQESRIKIKEIEKEDLFRKLVRILIDYVPDISNSVYMEVLKSKDAINHNLRRYIERNDRVAVEEREVFRKALLAKYNQKTSLK